ncbi:hypothetical protein [Bacillus sp. SM2101]|uniref:hypothetical protein n=1 Tax=Bacillus sp. SM2101 TaxID=2805366 RepID=UPI001BDE8389|nr:hypothetical protein [Bacillus sp. SM2101]
MQIVNLQSHKHQKQYVDYYKQGNLVLANDTQPHQRKDLHNTYTSAWIRLLSQNINKK